LNRFTKVYIDKFEPFDLLFITKNLFPQIDESDLKKMIQFNEELYRDTMVLCKYGRKGSPWEFNLRDILRWCQLMTGYKSHHLFDIIYVVRGRDRTILGGSEPSHIPLSAMIRSPPSLLDSAHTTI
jgi:midasin (ATPase involved in ribosome maturation)